jgi:multicomponent Na+:H+ antiporter subunit D
MLSSLPPFVLFFVGAIAVAFTRGPVRKGLILAIPLLGGLNLWFGVEPGIHLQFELLGYTLTPYRADKLSLLFGYLFHIAAFLGFLYALHLGDGTPDGAVDGVDHTGGDKAGLQHVSAMLYAGSAIGAVFAGDFITLFVFWELLAVTSAFLIWARESERSYATGFRYLIIHVVSGAGRMDSPDRLRDQGWIPAGAQLDYRGLSGKHAHGYGLSERVYDQGGRVCACPWFRGG